MGDKTTISDSATAARQPAWGLLRGSFGGESFFGGTTLMIGQPERRTQTATSSTEPGTRYTPLQEIAPAPAPPPVYSLLDWLGWWTYLAIMAGPSGDLLAVPRRRPASYPTASAGSGTEMEVRRAA